jgi:hypothetical protein
MILNSSLITQVAAEKGMFTFLVNIQVSTPLLHHSFLSPVSTFSNRGQPVTMEIYLYISFLLSSLHLFLYKAYLVLLYTHFKQEKAESIIV